MTRIHFTRITKTSTSEPLKFSEKKQNQLWRMRISSGKVTNGENVTIRWERCLLQEFLVSIFVRILLEWVISLKSVLNGVPAYNSLRNCATVKGQNAEVVGNSSERHANNRPRTLCYGNFFESLFDHVSLLSRWNRALQLVLILFRNTDGSVGTNKVRQDIDL